MALVNTLSIDDDDGLAAELGSSDDEEETVLEDVTMTSDDWYDAQTEQLRLWVQDETVFKPGSEEYNLAVKALTDFVNLPIDQPEVTTAMYNWLKLPGVFDILLSFVSRLEKTEVELGSARSMDLNLTKRSFNTMSLLAPLPPNRANYLIAQLLKNQVNTLVSSLLDVFDPRSNGNFHHFHRIFCKTLKAEGQKVVSAFIDKLKSGDTLKYLCDNLDQPMVLDFMYTLLEEPPEDPMMATYGLQQDISPEQRKEICQLLARGGYLDALGNVLTAAEPESKEHLANEITRLFSGELLVPPITNSQYLEPLVKQLYALAMELPAAPEVRIRATQALTAIMERCLTIHKREIEQGRETRPLLEADPTQHDIAVLYQQHLPMLCETILTAFTPNYVSSHNIGSVALPSHVVKAGFTTTRLAYIDLLYETLASCVDGATAVTMLEAQTPETAIIWRKLADLFLEYTENSLYQTLFYKIFVWIVHSEHQPTLKATRASAQPLTLQQALFSRSSKKPGLLTRLIQLYEGPSSAHGYLLLMFNALRLLEEQGGSSYVVKSILENHPGWQALRPAIIEKTKATVGFRIKPDSLNDLVGGMPGLPAHLAPRGPPSLCYGPETAVSLSEESEDEDSTSINLGSQFALFMGFRTPKPDAKRKMLEADISGEDGADVVDSPAAASPRKKKKKRKKKRAQASSESPAGSPLAPSSSASESESQDSEC